MHGHHHHPEHDHGGHDGHDHHGHDHTGHGHTHLPRNERKLAMAAVLTGGFMVAETVGGVISGSLALLADAGHMLTDFAALLLALLAIRIGRRPADWKRTYGFDRFSVLAAFVNGLSLFAIAIWITVEAVMRLREPTEVMGGLMLWIALAGLAVNTFSFLILTGGGEGNLNVRAAALHVMGDLLGSVAALAASLVIILTDWMPIDPILSVLVALIILRSGWAIVSESGHILLEGAPPGFDRRDVAARLMELDGVASVAHVHAWLVTQERPMVTLEMAAEPGSDIWQTKQAARSLLAEVYGISHVTIEMIDAPGQGIHCDS